MTTVLVTGIGGTRSIGIMKSLRDMNEPVRVIGTDANFFNAGAFQCDVAYIVPFASEEGYLARLEEIIAKENVSIVFASVEKEVAFLARHKAEIEAMGVVCLVPDPEVLAVCFDKYKTQQFLNDNDFTAIPCIYADNEDVIRRFADKNSFPLIRKPVMGYGSKGLSIIRTQKELTEIPKSSEYVLQRYIENEDTETFYNTVLNEYTAEVFINNDSSVAGGIILKRALHAGETVAGYRVDDERTLHYLSNIAVKLGIKGPCNFQYRKADGKVYIFEINPLFSGTTYVRAQFGFNNVALAIKSFVQGKHETIANSELEDKYFIRYLSETFIKPEDIKTLQTTGRFAKQ